MIERMRIRDFVDQGFLQELNRQFLHPRGLSLVVIYPDQPTDQDIDVRGYILDARTDLEALPKMEIDQVKLDSTRRARVRCTSPVPADAQPSAEAVGLQPKVASGDNIDFDT